jgi:hypothetical protein
VDFYLGTHRPHWLGLTEHPLFISRRQLTQRRALPKAIGPWALDSGGFTELSTFGEWTTTASEYVADVRRFADEVGLLEWAAPQDYMCEPWIVAKTGLSVREHQWRTVDNYLELRSMWPDGPFIPVLQGWESNQYLAHVEMYDRVGIDLAALSRVGLGSVCRRQGTMTVELIVRNLSALGIRLHGFGFKTQGIQRCADVLTSADSMAWSFRARRGLIRLPGHTHRTCANCLEWALQWREQVAALRTRDHQLPLDIMPRHKR